MSPSHIVVLATGGTIAGLASRADGGAYASGVLGIDDLLAALPGLDRVARVSAQQVFQADSVDLTMADRVRLCRLIEEQLARPDVDGVVVPHGTDTLEESAFLAHLTISSAKPVVFLGSMRPADALSADGPDNLFDAISVAAHPETWGLGILVIMDDRIHSARDVAKRNTTRTDAFASPWGPLGEVIDGRPYLVRAPIRAHTVTSAFTVDDLDHMPRVETIPTHADTPAGVLDALVDAGTRGIVHVGAGNGNIARPIVARLDDLVSRGITVVRATRVDSGIVTRNGAGDDDAHGFIVADDHHASHARVLLGLALARTSDRGQIQEWFFRH